MAMDEWFDGLAKDAAHRRLSRRQILGRVAAGVGVALLAGVGIRADKPAKADCGKLCHVCCENNFPDHGKEYGQCIADCHKGEGICGPIVCPQD